MGEDWQRAAIRAFVSGDCDKGFDLLWPIAVESGKTGDVYHKDVDLLLPIAILKRYARDGKQGPPNNNVNEIELSETVLGKLFAESLRLGEKHLLLQRSTVF